MSADSNGNLQAGRLRPGMDCGGVGVGERRLAGSLLAFPSGGYWLYVPTAGGQDLVITSFGGVATVNP